MVITNRGVIAAGVAVVLLAAPATASAARKRPPCPMTLTDPSGDAKARPVAIHSDHAKDAAKNDLLSLDVTSDANNLAIRVVLKETPSRSSGSVPREANVVTPYAVGYLETYYRVRFRDTRGARFGLVARFDDFGTFHSTAESLNAQGYWQARLGLPNGRVDDAKREITLVAPHAMWVSQYEAGFPVVKSGTVLTQFEVFVSHGGPPGLHDPEAAPFDSARVQKTYKVGAKQTCTARPVPTL